MENTSKTPDRLYISTKSKELIDKLDESNYFGLGKSTINRSELFLFAMALGIELDIETQFTNPYPGGLILEKSIDNKTIAIMYSECINTLSDPDNELDLITDKGRLYKLAEHLANTGFEVIDDYVKTKKPTELLLDLLIELDEQYEKIKSNI